MSPKKIEQIYEKLEHKEHILLRPDTYLGSIHSEQRELFVLNDDKSLIIKKNIKFIPALYKIFDEGLVNMRDHQVRMNQIISSGINSDNHDPSRTYHPVRNIDVSIDIAGNCITMLNDGEGIDVAFHEKEKVYVPELIFGFLLSGTNFDTSQKRIVGGMNGYGAKLINLFSTEFTIETLDVFRHKKYTQTFRNNMSIRDDPHIVSSRASVPYTKITFKPDLSRFGLKSLLDDDTISLMEKRVYDIAACTCSSVNVRFNDTKIPIKTFERYIDMYIGTRGSHKRYYSVVNNSWEIAVCSTLDGSDGFEQVSFVNGICTYDGGRHVDHVSQNICSRLAKFAIENKKGYADITSKSIKDNIIIFINCTIINPNFKSQTKEALTTLVSEFGSTCSVSDDFIEKLARTDSGILDKALRLSVFKADKNLKKSDGKKLTRINNERLMDAIYAGSKKSTDCTLILCEGESAKTFAVSGLDAFDLEKRKFYGILPLKGKIINPKDCKISTIEKNQQFSDLKQTIGLKQGVCYNTPETLASLRYGHIMIITDADVDGDHIKGLVFNMFHEFWPSLLCVDGFFCSILTEIVILKHKRTNQKLSFFSIPEFDNWKKLQNIDELSKWDTNYYKGLGTHLDSEAKECFLNMKLQTYSWNDITRFLQRQKQNCVSVVIEETETTTEINDDADKADKADKADNANNANETLNGSVVSVASSVASSECLELYNNYYDFAGKEYQNKLVTKRRKRKTEIRENAHLCDLAIDLAFKKSLANYRKGWITHYLQQLASGQTDLLLHKQDVLSYIDFINEKLINFSVYDNERNIPSIMDGLKPSQRKVLFSVFKKNITSKLKVAQLSGYVAENSAYHHGEDSLNKTIISMAQDYCGSNNINLLVPEGQFGTRIANGDDASAPRYIYTYINPITRDIFNKNDESLLSFLDDDGTPIEPLFYLPIIPMILVNGTRGIGTGWSTDIPSYNPIDIIANIQRYLDGTVMNPMIPWYRGFKGTISADPDNPERFKVIGVYVRTDDKTIVITELPVGNKDCKSFTDYEKFLKDMLFAEGQNMFDDIVVITGSKTILATVVFNDTSTLDKLWNSPNHEALEKLLKLSSSITTSNMHLFNYDRIMTKYYCPEDILAEFCFHRFKMFSIRRDNLISHHQNDINKASARVRFIKIVNDDSHPFDVRNRTKSDILTDLELLKFPKFADTFDYLLDMPIYSLTLERIAKLEKEVSDLKSHIDILKNTSTATMWKNDITTFETSLAKFEENWIKTYTVKPIISSKSKKSKKYA